MDIVNVRSYLDSLGKQLSPEAQQLLETIETKQMVSVELKIKKKNTLDVYDGFETLSLLPCEQIKWPFTHSQKTNKMVKMLCSRYE